VFDNEAAADSLFEAIAERRAADPDRRRPGPVDTVRYEVYGSAFG
jgi:hypothetical protein